MKKTIALALSLLASFSAAADTLGSYTFTLTSGEVSGVTINNTTNSALTLSLGDLTGSGTQGGTAPYQYWFNINDTKSLLTPHWNVGKANTSWSQSFSLTNTGTEALTVTGLKLGMLGITGSGGIQGTTSAVGNEAYTSWVNGESGNNNKPVNITVTDGDTLVYNLASTSWTDIATGAFSGMSWTLEAGATKTFTITAENNSLYTDGTFPAISSIELTGTKPTAPIPEPATATLSLLALAGLAARRRRK